MDLSPARHQRLRLLSILEVAVIVALAVVPLFVSFPYRVNIFLSWEGAYRLSEGQVPYRDFGMPLGFMYWVVPAVFFKLFGVQMITLVKAQVFLNIISGLAFRSILKSLAVPGGVRFLSVLLFCVSYSFFNFWPWYNHTVIVYELAGLAFLLRYTSGAGGRRRWWLLAVSGLLLFFSFFTKQDGGALAFLLAFALLVYHSVAGKDWTGLAIFCGSFFVAAMCILLPFARYDLGYWFNHGQPPHTARFSAFEIVEEFFNGSFWIKFYLFMFALVAVAQYKTAKQLITDRRDTLFLLLTLGILVQATILQVTSYTPPDNNIFFHSFAVAFLLTALSRHLQLDFSRWTPLLTGGAFLLLWWSSTFWKYIQRVAERTMPTAQAAPAGDENVVNRRTYMINRDTTEVQMGEWVFSPRPAFRKIYMPASTSAGIERLMNLELVKGTARPSVLNMTELTPLVVEMGYEPEKGPGVPLWHHLGVSMFNRQAARYEQLIRRKHYDLVLFEYIPALNNFYPFRVRDTLRRHYQLIDSFDAPRRGDTRGAIEVYRKPAH